MVPYSDTATATQDSPKTLAIISDKLAATMAKKDDAGDEDLEGLQLSINEKSDETLECTRRMREMCAEAKDSGDVSSLGARRDLSTNTV